MLKIWNGLFHTAWKSRLIFGAGFLFSVVYNQLFLVAAVQIMLASILLQLLDGSLQRINRALRLLVWIVLPMVVVHALFSPGRLIELFWLQISIDGALFGGWLAIHFIAIFMAALLLFRLLAVEEWVWMLTRLPVLRTRLLPYVVLIQPLRKEIGEIINRFRYRWQQGNKRLGRLFAIILLIMRAVLRIGPVQAERIWNDWDEQMKLVAARKPRSCSVSFLWTLFWPLFAGFWIWLAVAGVQ